MALSVFVLADGVVHHTYSCYDRGTDALNTTWGLLTAPRRAATRAPVRTGRAVTTSTRRREGEPDRRAGRSSRNRRYAR